MRDTTPNRPAADEALPSEEEQQRADDAFRELLAAYGQPVSLEPPADVDARVRASLPTVSPAVAAAAARRRARWRVVRQVGVLVLVLVLLLLGAWGVLVDSAALTALFGGAAAGLGYVALVLVLAAKPLVNVLLALALPLFFSGALTLALLVALWRLLAQQVPLMHVARAG
jgi:hypothetical protein